MLPPAPGHMNLPQACLSLSGEIVLPAELAVARRMSSVSLPKRICTAFDTVLAPRRAWTRIGFRTVTVRERRKCSRLRSHDVSPQLLSFLESCTEDPQGILHVRPLPDQRGHAFGEGEPSGLTRKLTGFTT